MVIEGLEAHTILPGPSSGEAGATSECDGSEFDVQSDLTVFSRANGLRKASTDDLISRLLLLHDCRWIFNALALSYALRQSAAGQGYMVNKRKS